MDMVIYRSGREGVEEGDRYDNRCGQMNTYTDAGKMGDEGVKGRWGRRKEMKCIHEGVWAT